MIPTPGRLGGSRHVFVAYRRPPRVLRGDELCLLPLSRNLLLQHRLDLVGLPPHLCRLVAGLQAEIGDPRKGSGARRAALADELTKPHQVCPILVRARPPQAQAAAFLPPPRSTAAHVAARRGGRCQASGGGRQTFLQAQPGVAEASIAIACLNVSCSA